MAREVYRDKRGRFVSKHDLWQGPTLPRDPQHPINVARERQRVEKWRKALTEVHNRQSYFHRFMGC